MYACKREAKKYRTPQNVVLPVTKSQVRKHGGIYPNSINELYLQHGHYLLRSKNGDIAYLHIDYGKGRFAISDSPVGGESKPFLADIEALAMDLITRKHKKNMMLK